jgi:translation initiation factor IF-2
LLSIRANPVLPFLFCSGPMTVGELAELINEKPVSVIKMLISDLGVMASISQSLDSATCIAVIEGFGMYVDGIDDMDEEDDEESALATGVVGDEDDEEDLEPRAPVVTIMGHVDHGKTSLLDAIRQTHVTAGEAGGITQAIAAYQVQHNGRPITFIDTPGHSAFTDMRERGANMTDIVILVVAADDGVKQQTADSIVCARMAGVPIVVAINKCDLETADPRKVMTDLTAYDLLTEEFGGDVLSSQISAKVGTGLDDLLDKIMLQAEIQDLKANPNRDADGIVIEAFTQKGMGTIATTLVKRGTLRVGDIFVAGETYGKVRALISTTDEKTRLTEVGPSTPVRVVGFEGVPLAGDLLVVAKDEQTARELAQSRQRIARELQSSTYQSGLMESITKAFGAKKEIREMCVVVKSDVQGSAEALTRSLRELKLENDEAIVTIKVLVSESGEVSKSDITIASVTPSTTVIAFNCAASYAAMEDARSRGVPIEYYNIIYDAIESVESRMQEILSPTPKGEYVGAAIVQEVFNIGGTGNIAGSRCTDGVLRKSGNVRVLRGDKILIESKISSLRNFKSEVDVIEAGNECGIGLETFEDFQADDIIECYVEK